MSDQSIKRDEIERLLFFWGGGGVSKGKDCVPKFIPLGYQSYWKFCTWDC